MKKGVLFTLILGTLVFSGCGNKQDANEKNFKVSIQSFLDSTYPKCYFYENFPAVPGDIDFKNEKATLAALLKVGLISVKDEPHEVDFGNTKKTLIKPTFYLTEEGKKFYKVNVEKTLGGQSIGGFCAGKAQVKEVPQFTDPADMFGLKVSNATFTYVVSDLPAWTKTPEILSAITSLKSDVESENKPIKGRADLILTNNGWVHQRLFQK